MKLDHAIRWTITPDNPLYRNGEIEDTDLIRDHSGEVRYFDEDGAIVEAMRLQEGTIRYSYTVEHRPAVISNENKED